MDMVGPRPEKRHLQNKGLECLFRQTDMGKLDTGRATHYPTCDVSTTPNVGEWPQTPLSDSLAGAFREIVFGDLSCLAR